MAKLDWRRAKPGRPNESVLGSATLRSNGELTPRVRKDGLARRADRAMQAWLRDRPQLRRQFE